MAARVMALLVLAALLAGCAGSAPLVDPNAPTTTLADVAAGTFGSAVDKQGTGGVQVLVRHVVVRDVHNESDGDWHLNASDATRGLILEIIPRDQAALGRPPPRVPLEVVGVPFCDHAHEAEAWHGSTCWELHPVLRWQREP